MEDKKNLGYRILNFSLTRIIIGFIVCIAVVSFGQAGVNELLGFSSIDQEYKNLISGVVVAILIIVVYIFLFKLYEKRNITELSTQRLARNLFLGISIGVILQSFTIFVIYLTGGFHVISVNSIIYLLPSLTMALTSSISEEILLRGILFRIIEEKLGSYIALAISALIFGALHLFNPNSSMIAALAIALEAGLLLGAAYIFTRNLWFPIALHFAWNFTQSGIFGAATSGNTISKSLLTTRIEGAELITGGQFGPEASVQAIFFGLTATVILMIIVNRQKKIIKPYWIK